MRPRLAYTLRYFYNTCLGSEIDSHRAGRRKITSAVSQNVY